MAKPKLALIPATQGSKLYSVLPADGVGDFNFSRNSAATRINKDGLIETVAVGKSRLNYPLIDGVVNGCPSHLLEPARTNLVTNSEDLSYFSKTNITEVNGNQVTPNGTIGSIKITPTSSAITQLQISSLTIGASYSFSFFVKKAEASHLIINQAGSAAQKISYDIGNLSYIGISGVDANIVSYGNEWVRVEYSVNSLTYNNIRIILSDGSDNYPYNPPIGDGLYLWGFQLEQGSFPTSYIPNYGTSAGITRVAETANGAGDASTFNDSEGVLMAEISALTNSGGKWISLSNGSTSQRISFANENGNIRVYIFNGVVIWDYIYYNINTITSNKISLKYKSGDYSLFINGFKINTSTSSLVASGIDSLQFNSGGGSGNFEGNTKQIQYFDSALNDSDLEKLTSWTSFTAMANAQSYTII